MRVNHFVYYLPKLMRHVPNHVLLLSSIERSSMLSDALTTSTARNLNTLSKSRNDWRDFAARVEIQPLSIT